MTLAACTLRAAARPAAASAGLSQAGSHLPVLFPPYENQQQDLHDAWHVQRARTPEERGNWFCLLLDCAAQDGDLQVNMLR